MSAHQPSDVRIVADAGLVSEANREAIEDARLSYVIGTRIPETP
jgi:transposase